MSFPSAHVITLIAYRPSPAVESLGDLETYVQSSFSFFVFSSLEEAACRGKMRDIIARDLRHRRENARVPIHSLVLLVNGRLPFSNDKAHADWMIRTAIQEASDQVETEFRRLELARQQEAKCENEREGDFRILRELHKKYSMAELRTAGVFDKDDDPGRDDQ